MTYMYLKGQSPIYKTTEWNVAISDNGVVIPDTRCYNSNESYRILTLSGNMK